MFGVMPRVFGARRVRVVLCLEGLGVCGTHLRVGRGDIVGRNPRGWVEISIQLVFGLFWLELVFFPFLSFPFLLFSSLKAGFYTLGCDVDELMVPFRRPDFRTLARNRVGLAP
jgi:hypothetical protein